MILLFKLSKPNNKDKEAKVEMEDERGYIFSLDRDETKILKQIAERDGISLEQALKKAMENFLQIGVQTPNHTRRCA